MVSGRDRVGSTSHATTVTSQNTLTPYLNPPSSIKTDHPASALSVHTILAPPRSTSLPASTGMGQCFSTPQPPLPTQTPPPMSPLSAAKGLTAAMAPSKLKRALVARRKKSEDVSALLDWSASRDEAEQQRHRPPNHMEAIAASSAQMSHSHAGGVMYTLPGPQNQHARNLSQLATQVFGRKSSKSSLQQQQQPPQREVLPQPPALPPKPPAEVPAPSNPVRTVHPLTPKERADNRSSIIPMTPEMSSAVNYMRMAAEEERKDEQAVVVVENLKREEQQVVDATERPQEMEKDGEKAGSNPWRMSDSTISQRTIRPDPGSTWSPRPVSMAESLQSTRTIVPVNKRQSVLIDDPDFGMPEEDDSTEEGDNSTPPLTPDKDIHLNILPVFNLRGDSPTPSMKARNRRSLSLSVTTHAILSKSRLLRSPSSSSHNPRYPHQETPSPTPPSSLSTDPSPAPPSMGVQLASPNTHVRSATIPNPSTSSTHHQTMNSLTSSMLSPSDLERTRNLPSLPNPPMRSPPSSGHGHSFRQTAVSITGGLAPAAGLAKRAVEKMGRAWGIHSSSLSSGASSSSLSHTTPPSSYSSSVTGSVASSRKQKLEPPGAKEMARAGSVDHHSTRGHHHHHKKGARLRRTPDASSVSSTHSMTASTASMSISDSEPSGPSLGKRLRGPLRTKSGGLLASGMVFGRDLKSVVKETGVGVGKPKVWGGRWRNWEEEEGVDGEEREVMTRTLSVRKGQLKALEERKLPALVVRCAQHLLIWGIQEEGLFR